VVRMITIIALTLSYSQMVRAEDFPTIQLTDVPTPSSTSTTITPAPVAAAVPIPTVSAPMEPPQTVPVPTDMGVTLDSPTITPTSIGVVAPTPTVAPPTSTTNPILSSPVAVNSPSATTVTPGTAQPTITLQPTTTYFPTITAQPTRTANPTSAECNICISGTISTNDLIVFDVGNVTCVEAQEFGLMGQISSTNCDVIQQLLIDTNGCSCRRENGTVLDVPSASPSLETFDSCNICGDGYYVSNDEAKLMFDVGEFGNITCGFAKEIGNAGLLAPEACNLVQNQTSPLHNYTNNNPCGCVVGTMPPTPATCYVCGSSNERVTLLDTIVVIPEDVLDLLPDAANVSSSLYTCDFVEKNFNTTLEAIICEIIQMQVADVCRCQVPNVVETVAPVPSPTSSPINTNNTTSFATAAQPYRWNTFVVLFPLFYYIL
jgi:hypothetical protein